MFIPKKFEQNDESQLIELVSNYPFAALVCTSHSGLEATHIPLYLVEMPEGKQVLKGHIARANTLWEIVEKQSSVLVIFQGPQSYVSPNFYPTKKEHGKAVPTWNYVSVHIKGEISFINDAEWKLDMLARLTDKLEAEEASPWKVSDAPKDYIEKQLGGIVGIEIMVNSIEGQWKLSQNQPAQNQAGVIEGLAESLRYGAGTMSDLMKHSGGNATKK